ncbi:MAG: diguanylate cyclase [Cellulomonas sp.]
MARAPAQVSLCRELVRPSEFGQFDVLSDIAHRHYVDGFSEESITACQKWLLLTVAAGDVITTRYLLYIEAIALEERGRNEEAITVARALLVGLGDSLEPMWRAKALSVVAEASTRLGRHGDAIAALAEADWLLQAIPTNTYGHLSASMAVALALRSLSLLEQADAALTGIRGGHDAGSDVYVLQELALLRTYWGAALLLIGREREAIGQFALGASRARAMVRLAASEGDIQMVARGEVIEAYTTMHLGEPALAAARVRAATQQFVARPELVETLLMQLVLAQEATTAGNFADALERLTTLISHTEIASREVWAATVQASLAQVHESQLGPHPGLDVWRTVARDAMIRVWSEREMRFAALRDRDHLRELAAETDRVGQASMQDPLTRLGNRRVLDRFMAQNPGRAWAVFVDVDHFKHINDTYSHAAGDRVLIALADILRAQSRDADLLVRYGGDEFLILPTGGEGAAVAVAQRVHEAVAAEQWSSIVDGLSVTVSIGVGQGADASPDPLAAADVALMSAKRTGRNQIVVAS